MKVLSDFFRVCPFGVATRSVLEVFGPDYFGFRMFFR
jgi:hypothetical protein